MTKSEGKHRDSGKSPEPTALTPDIRVVRLKRRSDIADDAGAYSHRDDLTRRLQSYCRSLVSLLSADQASVWMLEPQLLGESARAITFVAGAGWDGQVIALDRSWSSVPVASVAGFERALASNIRVVIGDPNKSGQSTKNLAQSLDLGPYSCEPIGKSDDPLGILLVSRPRDDSCDGVGLFQVIIEETVRVLEALRIASRSRDASQLLKILGEARSARSPIESIAALASRLASRTKCERVTVLMSNGRAHDEGPANGQEIIDSSDNSPTSTKPHIANEPHLKVPTAIGESPSYVPLVSVIRDRLERPAPSPYSGMDSWRDFSPEKGSVAQALEIWASSGRPVAIEASGWWKRRLGAEVVIGTRIMSGDSVVGILIQEYTDTRALTPKKLKLATDIAQLISLFAVSDSAMHSGLDVTFPSGGEDAIREAKTVDQLKEVAAKLAIQLFGTSVSNVIPISSPNSNGNGTHLGPLEESIKSGLPWCVNDCSVRGLQVSVGGTQLASAICIPLGVDPGTPGGPASGSPEYLVVAGDEERSRDWSDNDLVMARLLSVRLSMDLELLRLKEEDLGHQVSLARQLLHDPLTGAPNTILLLERIEQSIRRAKRDNSPLSLFTMDIDGLDRINALLGKDAGDSLLIQVATRLQDSLRASDVVARLADDEFAFLLTTSAAESGARSVIDKIIHSLSFPFNLSGEAVTPSFKFGAALYPDHASEPESLLAASKRALTKAATPDPKLPGPQS